MNILSKEVKIISVDCSYRLNQLLERFYDYRLKYGNTWFNKEKNKRLEYHLQKVSSQIRRHVLKQHHSVLASISLKRKFGKRNSYSSKILVQVGENK